VQIDGLGIVKEPMMLEKFSKLYFLGGGIVDSQKIVR